MMKRKAKTIDRHGVCLNRLAPLSLSLKESESWSIANKLLGAFEDLGKVGLRLMSRSFVTDETDDLCRGFSSYASGCSFWQRVRTAVVWRSR